MAIITRLEPCPYCKYEGIYRRRRAGMLRIICASCHAQLEATALATKPKPVEPEIPSLDLRVKALLIGGG